MKKQTKNLKNLKVFWGLTIMAFLLAFPVLGLCQGWQSTERLTYADSSAKIWGGTRWPVAVGLNNTVHIVWEDRRDGWAKEIYYKCSLDNGQTWETEIPLTINSTFFQSVPGISADKQNRLHVVYTEEVYNGPIVYPTIHYKRSDDGGNTWGPQITIVSLQGAVMHWSVATDLQNGVYIVYTDQTGTWYDEIDIFIAYSIDAGETWNTQQLSTSQKTVAGSVTADTMGRVHVVWLDKGTGTWQIMYRRSTDKGQTWEPIYTLTTTPSYKGLPGIYTDRNNTVHVVWYDNRNGEYEVYYIRSTDSGQTWSAENRITYTGIYPRGSPNITADLAGNVYVVWADTVGTLGAIGFNESTDNGSTWSQDTIVTAPVDVDGFNFYPGIAVSNEGNYFHLVWSDKRTGYFEVYYKQRVSGTWVQEKLISDKNPLFFKIMQNPTRGNVFIKMISGNREKIYVKIFNLSGNLVKKLANNHLKMLVWDGTDYKGRAVPSGIYIISAQGSGISEQKKVIMFRK